MGKFDECKTVQLYMFFPTFVTFVGLTNLHTSALFVILHKLQEVPEKKRTKLVHRN